jgi:hypothetical protein
MSAHTALPSASRCDPQSALSVSMIISPQPLSSPGRASWRTGMAVLASQTWMTMDVPSEVIQIRTTGVLASLNVADA